MTVTWNRQVELVHPPGEQGLPERVEEFLDVFNQTQSDDVLPWILRPMLGEQFVSHEGRSLIPRLSLARHILASQFRARGVYALSQGPVTFAMDGTNLRRVLEPIITARSTTVAEVRRKLPELNRKHLAHWTGIASSYAEGLLRASKRAGIRVQRGQIHEYCFAGARAIARAHGLLDDGQTRLLVVATQHAANMRALLAVGRRRGVASLYFPHAPAAANRQYADLPVDFAGLRGPGEVLLYRRYGVRRELDSVGNPAVDDIVDFESLTLSQPPVLAVSPHSPAVLADLFKLTASVLGDRDVLVAPHPRSDVNQLIRLLPARWRLSSYARTIDLLRNGPRFVLQHSSGIAWEALFLGIPVIQIGYAQAPPGYPLIAPPFVLSAHSTETLAYSVAAATERGQDAGSRDELRSWARHWCDSVGRGARESCVGLIERSLGQGPRPEALLDGWRSA
jgi:hypothetical protein